MGGITGKQSCVAAVQGEGEAGREATGGGRGASGRG